LSLPRFFAGIFAFVFLFALALLTPWNKGIQAQGLGLLALHQARYRLLQRLSRAQQNGIRLD
jgi:hypothetical protein